MRTMYVLAACTMAWAMSVGVVGARAAGDEVPPSVDITLCLTPMAAVIQSGGSCPDHPGSLNGGGQGLTRE
ncbi:MAG TPA: hypothetical protein VJT32_14700 [bacterium]|nr:hypothetical protein [bacterium]